MLTIFVILGLTMSFMCSLFGLMFTSSMKDGWRRTVTATIISLVIGFGLVGAMFAEKAYDTEQWNDGKCACGGEWDFTDVEHHRNGGDTYYYECDECGSLLQTSSHFH